MDCRNIQSKLVSYVGGQLSADEHKLVRGHLQECPSCRAALTEIDPVASVLALADSPTVPSDLTTSIMAAARDRMRHQRPAPWNPLSWWRLAPASMQAAAVGILVVGLGLGFTLGMSTAKSAATEATIGPQADPLEVYQLDYFGDAPSGSLADGYLALISPEDNGGQ
jgi:predicted anti-sigma-YlaC factor YlaD